MRQFHDVKYRSKEKQELKTKPGPLIIKTLVSNSHSIDFDSAKTEWEFMGSITSDSQEFVANCELCNHRNQIENFLIYNPTTDRYLKVGSDCIKRFIILNGTKTQEESNTFFEQKKNEIRKEYKLIELYSAVILEILPLARTTNLFRKTLIQLLDARGQLHLIENTEGIKEIMSSIF